MGRAKYIELQRFIWKDLKLMMYLTENDVEYIANHNNLSKWLYLMSGTIDGDWLLMIKFKYNANKQRINNLTSVLQNIRNEGYIVNPGIVTNGFYRFAILESNGSNKWKQTSTYQVPDDI